MGFIFATLWAHARPAPQATKRRHIEHARLAGRGSPGVEPRGGDIQLNASATSSDDAAAALARADAALRSHPSVAIVQKNASLLLERLEHPSTPLVDGALPERAALARVAELKGRRDFASLMRDMDAFPECEELQRAGCDAIDDILQHGESHEEAATAGAIECIVQALVLFPFSADTQRTSMMALVGLTCLEASAHRAGNAGAVRFAVDALRPFPLDANLIYAAVAVLGNISAEVQFRVEALDWGVLALVVSALRRYDLHRSHLTLTLR